MGILWNLVVQEMLTKVEWNLRYPKSFKSLVFSKHGLIGASRKKRHVIFLSTKMNDVEIHRKTNIHGCAYFAGAVLFVNKN